MTLSDVGVGSAAIRTLTSWLHDQPGCTAVRLSYHPDNVVAQRLYASVGFRPTGTMEGDEVVVEHR